MQIRNMLAPALAVTLALGALGLARADGGEHAFSPAITGEDLAAHIRELASDRFGGRGPGTEGERLTTDYIAGQFARMGLEPGNAGQWLQTVPAVSTTLLNPDARLAVEAGDTRVEFDYATDFMAGTLRQQPEAVLDGSEILFLGYGVDAPEHDWNDFADVDVRGKTIIVLVNDPGWGNQDPDLFEGRKMTYYGRWTYKFEEAARKGAAACFVVHETKGASYGWQVVASSWSGPQLALPLGADSEPTLPVAGWLTTEAAEKIFAAAGQDFAKLKASADHRGFRAVPLAARASLALQNRIEHFESHNVVGLLRGSEAPEESVIYTAHWDHLGTDPSREGDQIFNGAVDNASGVAALLEVAGAFAAQEEKPRRSVLFVAVTLEESGLLGSQYYAEHPVLPLATTAANINMDALPIVGRSRNMGVTGHGNSTLDNLIAAVAAAQGRHITGDMMPEGGGFFRSDHLNFVKAGVPALYAAGGIDLVDGGVEAGRAKLFGRNTYHQPSDEFDPSWDFSGMVEDVRAFYAVGRQLAGSRHWPQWTADNQFSAERAKTVALRKP